MPELTLSQVAQVIDGTLIGNPNIRITGISTDSRTTKPGDLFCAILGERTDGHDHIAQAKENGAVAYLASREVTGDHVLVPNVAGEQMSATNARHRPDAKAVSSCTLKLQLAA